MGPKGNMKDTSGASTPCERASEKTFMTLRAVSFQVKVPLVLSKNTTSISAAAKSSACLRITHSSSPS